MSDIQEKFSKLVGKKVSKALATLEGIHYSWLIYFDDGTTLEFEHETNEAVVSINGVDLTE